jgi:hypothetical protein
MKSVPRLCKYFYELDKSERELISAVSQITLIYELWSLTFTTVTCHTPVQYYHFIFTSQSTKCYELLAHHLLDFGSSPCSKFSFEVSPDM